MSGNRSVSPSIEVAKLPDEYSLQQTEFSRKAVGVLKRFREALETSSVQSNHLEELSKVLAHPQAWTCDGRKLRNFHLEALYLLKDLSQESRKTYELIQAGAENQLKAIASSSGSFMEKARALSDLAFTSPLTEAGNQALFIAGRFYMEVNELELAEIYFKRAIQDAKSGSDIQTQAFAYGSMAAAMRGDQQKLDAMLDDMQRINPEIYMAGKKSTVGEVATEIRKVQKRPGQSPLIDRAATGTLASDDYKRAIRFTNDYTLLHASIDEYLAADDSEPWCVDTFANASYEKLAEKVPLDEATSRRLDKSLRKAGGRALSPAIALVKRDTKWATTYIWETIQTWFRNSPQLQPDWIVALLDGFEADHSIDKAMIGLLTSHPDLDKLDKPIKERLAREALRLATPDSPSLEVLLRLGELPPSIGDQLVKMLTAPIPTFNFSHERGLLRLVSGIQDPDTEKFLPVLVKFFQHEDHRVREAAVHSAEKLVAKDFTISSIAYEEIKKLLTHPKLGELESVLRAFLPALTRVEDQHREEALKILFGYLKSNGPGRDIAERIAANMTDIPDGVVGDLIAALKELNWGYASKIVPLLGHVKGKNAELARAALVDQIERDVAARLAVKTLVAMGKDSVPILMGLFDRYVEAQPSLSFEVEQGLVELKEQSVPLLLERVKNAEPKVQARMMWLLARSQDERALPTLIEALASKDSEVNSAAVSGFNHFGVEAVEPLIAQLDRKDDVPRDAAIALSRMGKKALPALIKTLKHEDPRLREGAALAIDYMRYKAKSGLPEFKKLLEEKDLDPSVREELQGIVAYLEDPLRGVPENLHAFRLKQLQEEEQE